MQISKRNNVCAFVHATLINNCIRRYFGTSQTQIFLNVAKINKKNIG